jgi:hypothetical protein
MILCKSKFVSLVQEYMASKPIKNGNKCSLFVAHILVTFMHVKHMLGQNLSLKDQQLIVGGRGEGHTLVTDNWYTSSNNFLMMKVYQEYKMSLIGTLTPTKKSFSDC